MVDHFRVIWKILSSSNGCELIENGYRFDNSRIYLCFHRFWKQRILFCSTERTSFPKKLQNAPKNSCTSDFFPKGIQRSEVRASTHQTILVYPPIFANENQRSTVRMSSHLVFITLTTSVQWLFTIIPTGELWKNKVHQKKILSLPLWSSLTACS